MREGVTIALLSPYAMLLARKSSERDSPGVLALERQALRLSPRPLQGTGRSFARMQQKNLSRR